jgi:TetR/AcrR family transcriptional regulator
MSDRGEGERPPPAASPLYARLPRGPHRLGRGEVLLNQRRRLQGAMVAAVAAGGYEATSVKQVVRLAGVSRRAFYEQFANREECFGATFDEIVSSALSGARAARTHPGARREQALAAIVHSLSAGVAANPSAAALVALHAESAGPHGIAGVRRAAGAFERTLTQTLWAADEHKLPPPPIVRAFVGGAHGIVRAATERPAQHLERDLLEWMTPLAAGIDADLARAIAAAGAESLRVREAGSGPARAPREPSTPREALLGAALRLAVLGEHAEVSGARIADEAGLAVEDFFAAFADRDACYAAAQRRLTADLLDAVERAGSQKAWPATVRTRIDALLTRLADRPLAAHTIAVGAFAAGAEAVRRNRVLSLEIAGRLLGDAPVATDRVDAVAGAIWHVIGTQAAGGRTQLLPALRDHLAYVVTASVLGAEAAASALSERLDRLGASGGGDG